MFSASVLANDWGASDGRRHEIVPHPERSGRATLDKDIEHVQDRLAQGWIALEFQRPCVDMPLEKNFEHEDGVGLAQHVGGISAPERVRDAHERCGHGTLADVVEEADVAVQHDPDRRQRIEERVDVVGVAFKASPVTDVVLPPRGQEDRREHLTAARMLLAQMREPLGALDPLGKQLP
ncbi:hypothetical protein PT2222_70201 [Paraburkholderia tropica]